MEQPFITKLAMAAADAGLTTKTLILGGKGGRATNFCRFLGGLRNVSVSFFKSDTVLNEHGV